MQKREPFPSEEPALATLVDRAQNVSGLAFANDAGEIAAGHVSDEPHPPLTLFCNNENLAEVLAQTNAKPRWLARVLYQRCHRAWLIFATVIRDISLPPIEAV